jgi:hypothetical protein
MMGQFNGRRAAAARLGGAAATELTSAALVLVDTAGCDGFEEVFMLTPPCIFN